MSTRSKFSYKNLKLKTEIKKENDFSPWPKSVMNTPSSSNNVQVDGDSDYSPVYFPLTQETNEDIDVLWDWHSPQTSQRKRRKKKRLIVPVQSPKFPLERHPSNNQSQNFEKLRNELKALQEELARPDDESCLWVSPQQEQEIKEAEGNNLVLDVEPDHCDDFNDFFNDSLDEQLILCSQKIENEILDKNDTKQCNEKKNFTTKLCDNAVIDNLINKYSEKSIGKTSSNVFDDDLSTFNIDNISFSNNTPKRSKNTFQRTISENVIQTVSGKLEFHRTKSFELAELNNGPFNLPKNTLEEIERKRLEAKAKLESKRKKEQINTQSPPKCSLQEIEKKRLQALAKLEAKRLQDIVEKKRQEALKKLQASRMKNAGHVISTLTKRLQK